MKEKTLPGRQTIDIYAHGSGTILISQGRLSDGGYEDTIEILPHDLNIFIEMLQSAAKEIEDSQK